MGIAPVTRNAAEADIDGFELELTAIPADGWLIQAGIGYLDAEYTSLDPSENFTTDRLEEIAAENDLSIVAAGRGEIQQLFPPDEAHST